MQNTYVLYTLATQLVIFCIHNFFSLVFLVIMTENNESPKANKLKIAHSVSLCQKTVSSLPFFRTYLLTYLQIRHFRWPKHKLPKSFFFAVLFHEFSRRSVQQQSSMSKRSETSCKKASSCSLKMTMTKGVIHKWRNYLHYTIYSPNPNASF